MNARLLVLALVVALSPVAALAQPGFSKAFSPSTIGPGSVSTLTFTIDNTGGALPATSLAFTDVLPAGMIIASPANASTTCETGRGGTVDLNAPSGGTTISFTGAGVSGGEACTVSVNVTSSTPGVYTNISGALTSSAGSSGTATADLTVSTDRPGFTKSFAPSTIPFGGRSRLTFTIDNTANLDGAIDLTFTDALPVGMSVASPANATTTCGNATVTATPGSASVALSPTFTGGSTVGAGASCTVGVDVTASSTGSLGNVSGDLTSRTPSFGPLRSSGKAGAVLVVVTDALALTKSFVNDPVAPGGTVTLRFSITNLDRRDPATAVTFTDDLDATLAGLVAVGPFPTDPCGAGSSLTGTDVLTLTDGALDVGGSCSFDVTLSVPTSAATGVYPNTTSLISGMAGGSPILGQAASDNLFVAPVPRLTKEFVDDPASPGATVTLRFTITNSSPTESATDLAFTDILSPLVDPPLASRLSLPASGFCGAGATANVISLGVGEQGLAVSGASLAPGGSCTFDVGLDLSLGLAGGTYTNTTSAITGTVGGTMQTGAPASDDLVVVVGPNLSLAFPDGPAAPGSATTLAFSLSMDAEVGLGASAIAFSTDLDAALSGLVATGLPVNACGGTLSSTDGGSTLDFAGGALAPGETCPFNVALSVPAGASPGTFPVTTSATSADVGGVMVSGAPAFDDLVVTTLTFSKSFTDDPTTPGGTVTLAYTITNVGQGGTATGLQFSDNLNAALSGLAATGLPVTDVCGTGSQLSGTGTATLTGGSLAQGASCTFSVTLAVPAGASSGDYSSTSGPLAGTISGSPVSAPGATDVLTVTADSPPAFAKAFAPGTITSGGISTLTFTIGNEANSSAATSLAFSDNLPIPVRVASPANASTTCTGGTLAATPGSGVIGYSGGSVAAGASCTISVDVTSSTAGSHTNTSGALTSSLGTSSTATAILTVIAVDLSASKTDALADLDGDNLGDPGEVITYTIVATNSGARTSSTVTLQDTPDPNTTLVVGSVATSQGTIVTGNTTGDTSIEVNLGPIAPSGGTATVTFDVTVNGPLPSSLVEVCNRGRLTGAFLDVLTGDPGKSMFDSPTCTGVDPNQPPVANAGADQTLECAAPTGTAVSLDGTGSSDPDGDPLTYSWAGSFPEGGGVATGPTPTVTLGLGTFEIVLTVTDPSGESDADTVAVTVGDTTPPVLAVGASPASLWPPNHAYHSFALADLGLTASDACDGTVSAANAVATQVTSDEPEDGDGDGDTLDDIVIGTSCTTVDVRAERQGSGDGRVYTLTLGLADASGNVGAATYEVQVPKSRRGAAIAGPPVYTVAGCSATPLVLADALPEADALTSETPQTIGLPLPEAALTTPLPEALALGTIYPNPLTRAAQVAFAAPEATRLRLAVYDALGREVAVLVDGPVEAGWHEATLRVTSWPSGTYLVRMSAEGGFAETRPLTVIR